MQFLTQKLRFLVGFGLIISLGCGGSKQTVTPEPDPFPTAEEQTEERNATQAEEPKPAEPVVRDIEPAEQSLVLRTVYFEFDRSELTSEARAALAENARQLTANATVRVRIEGHCDERGTVDYNLALGERRALATRDYLVSFGVDPGRITIISYGKERPVDPRHSADAWAKNRRAEFVKLN